jgi:hypothetical protein
MPPKTRTQAKKEGVKIQQTPIMRSERVTRPPRATEKSATHARAANGASEGPSARDSLFLKIGRIDSMNVNQLACKVVARIRDDAEAFGAYRDTSLGQGCCQEHAFNVDHYIDVMVKHGDKEEHVIKQVFDDVRYILSTLAYIMGPRHVVYYDLVFIEEGVGIDANILRFKLPSARGTPPISVVVPEE